MASTAGPKARITMGGGGPTSRRNTRKAGVRESCSNGGRAQPPSTATAVRKPDAKRCEARWRQVAAQPARQKL